MTIKRLSNFQINFNLIKNYKILPLSTSSGLRFQKLKGQSRYIIN